MSKATLIDVVREHTECTVNAAKEAVDAMFETISKALKKEGSMAIVGFGTFKVSKRAARMGRNPQTGAAIKIAAGKTVRFKASKQLKEAV
jgi:nucleoid DNA-binding protein